MAIETGPLFEANEKSKSQSSNNGPAFQPVRLPKFITAPSLAPETPSERRIPQEFTFFVREQVEHASKSEKDSIDDEDEGKSSKNGKTKRTVSGHSQGVTYHAAPEAINYASVNLEPDAEKDADDAHFADDNLSGQPPKLTVPPVPRFDSRVPIYSSHEGGHTNVEPGTQQISPPVQTSIHAPGVPQGHETSAWQAPTEPAFPSMEGHPDSSLSHNEHANDTVPPIPPSGPEEYGGFNEPPEPPKSPLNRYSYAPYPQQQTMYNTAPPSPSVVTQTEAPQVIPDTVRAVDRPARALTALEYLLRKRADRKLEKRVNERIDAVDKKHDAAAVANQFKVQSEQRQQNAEIRNSQTIPYGEQQTAPVVTQETPFVVGVSPQPHEVRFSAPSAGPSRQEQAFSGSPIDSLPPIKPVVEVSPEAQLTTSRAATASEGAPSEHLRHPAWQAGVEKGGHTINETIPYGKEFQEEQKAEAHPVAKVQQYAGGAVHQQSYSQPTYTSSNGALPSGMTAPTLATGQSTHVDPQHQLPPTAKKTFTAPGPLFWVMFAALLIAFFAAALI